MESKMLSLYYMHTLSSKRALTTTNTTLNHWFINTQTLQEHKEDFIVSEVVSSTSHKTQLVFSKK